ncbi:hypothetical protein BTVI_122187 [Pitangus sulphuratus]|nr:hypothetical protein BTVI_122187 [Pitangus sulphuratus]
MSLLTWKLQSDIQHVPSVSIPKLVCGQLTGQVTLKIANEPVLPFNALDIALEVQNSLKADCLSSKKFNHTVYKNKGSQVDADHVSRLGVVEADVICYSQSLGHTETHADLPKIGVCAPALWLCSTRQTRPVFPMVDFNLYPKIIPHGLLDLKTSEPKLIFEKRIRGDEVGVPQLLAVASRLRDTAELFQSDEMRPANDPKERAPVRVRMLNDVLQSLEKSFLVHRAPPGLYRNILYRLDERTSQFSLLLEALEHCKLHQSNETIQAALSEVLNSINSAQVYFKAGLDVFETTLAGKK